MEVLLNRDDLQTKFYIDIFPLIENTSAHPVSVGKSQALIVVLIFIMYYCKLYENIGYMVNITR